MYRARDGNVYSHKETPEEYEARRGVRTIRVDPLGVLVLLFIGAAVLEYLLPILVNAALFALAALLLWAFRGILLNLIKKTLSNAKAFLSRK